VVGARVTARNTATNLERLAIVDDLGTYQIPALPVGIYRLEISANGFRTKVIESVMAEVGTVVVQDIQLEVGDVAQVVHVHADTESVELTNVAVGQVINERTVQEIPLNGR